MRDSNKQCGISTDGTNYSTWLDLDLSGRPMPWNSQKVYRTEDLITDEVVLTAKHGGRVGAMYFIGLEVVLRQLNIELLISAVIARHSSL